MLFCWVGELSIIKLSILPEIVNTFSDMPIRRREKRRGDWKSAVIG